MARKNKLKQPKHKVFTSPGTLDYIGKEVNASVVIKRFFYDATQVQEVQIKNLNDAYLTTTDNQVLWLDVDGVHHSEIIESVGQLYCLHPLLLEDVLNTTQKAKIEYYEEANQLFVVVKMLHFNRQTLEIDTEQVSFVLGKNFLISFQEQDGTDNFMSVHERISRPNSRTRRYGADFLLYVLMDLIVDNYFLVLDEIAEELEAIEEKILDNPTSYEQNRLYKIKREMVFMRKAILPLRDMIGVLIREESDLVGNKVNVYLRDVQDHAFQILDTLDTYRDVAENIMANYHSLLGNKMNQVMKTLTVFTAVFMPLTFIAGVYGMNFDNMPELKHPYGYFITLAAMMFIGVGLWFYFKWKKYL